MAVIVNSHNPISEESNNDKVRCLRPIFASPSTAVRTSAPNAPDDDISLPKSPRGEGGEDEYDRDRHWPWVTPSHLLHLLLRWSLPLYKARAGAQQGRRRAGRGSRLAGWWPMCGGLSEVVARLKVEAERQHYHLDWVVGQRKWGCVKSFVIVFLLLVRRTVIARTGY
jgi:hypothetical protein